MKTVNYLLNQNRFREALNAAEKEIYLAAYEYAGHNQVVAARILGVSRTTLIGRLRKWKIERMKDVRERCSTV